MAVSVAVRGRLRNQRMLGRMSQVRRAHVVAVLGSLGALEREWAEHHKRAAEPVNTVAGISLDALRRRRERLRCGLSLPELGLETLDLRFESRDLLHLHIVLLLVPLGVRTEMVLAAVIPVKVVHADPLVALLARLGVPILEREEMLALVEVAPFAVSHGEEGKGPD